MTTTIAALTDAHQRQDFDCGDPQTNTWLRSASTRHERRGLFRTFVATPAGQPTQVCACYVLTPLELDLAALPEKRRRDQASRLPALRLWRLAVDRNWRVQEPSIAEAMLADAVRRARQAAAATEIVALAATADDTNGRKFYLRYGFTPLHDQPDLLLLPLR